MFRLSPVLVTAAIAAFGFTAAPAAGQSSDSPFSAGFQSSWPSYGLSVRYDLNERMQAQGVVGAFGAVTNFSGRLNYDVKDEEKYDVYGFGSVGLWRYSYRVLGVGASESSVGFGGGAGVEFDLEEVFSPDSDDFPPLFWSVELGVNVASLDAYNFSTISMGAGLHYHF